MNVFFSTISQVVASLLLAVSICSSCAKDEAMEFPYTIKGRSMNKGAIRMFIGGKEIFDIKLINSFINKDYFNQKYTPQSDEITFLSADTATFNSNEYQQKFSVKRKGDQFLFYSVISFPVFPTNYARFDYIYKHQFDDKQYIPFGGYLTKSVHVGYGTYYELRLRSMAYKFTYDRRGASGMNAGVVLNEFSGDISFLQEKDTLAIQEYNLVFRR